MKLSIIIAVLDSHEIVDRQCKYWNCHGYDPNYGGEVEFIIVDDGSDPSIFDTVTYRYPRVYTITTNDKRKWTQGLARMKGIEACSGEYIFCTDIDHIISREAIEFALSFDGDKAVFQRRFAYLDEDGRLIRDKEKLLAWGLNPAAIRDTELSDGVHGNTWLMRTQVFRELGGYNMDRCNSGTHLQGEDREFNGRWSKASNRDKKYKAQVGGPPIYFFPTGRYHVSGDDNPHELFHGLEHTGWDQT